MTLPNCAKCVQVYCRKGGWKVEELPDFCPMKTKGEIIRKALEKYKEEENRLLYLNSTITEQRAYQMVRGRIIGVRPRLLEIIKFSEMMGWKRLGVAFCTGLSDEARRVVEILEKAGFEVCSVRCKCGGIDKTELGVPKEYKISSLYGRPDSFEAGCNPIVQAEVLNSEEVELNIIVGLCIGHDILFSKYSKAPVTTLIVKDRVTGHNPVASLYSAYHNPRYYSEL
ncbi:MAG: hypothetical protein DRO05_05685 [Thermoproteota archaeon]|nr:MAG: hypothetical protein DRO05_05685 [Candidatus Korarchaeota archaeon]